MCFTKGDNAAALIIFVEILKQVLNAAQGGGATIDISKEAKGIYFVEMKTERGVVRKIRIKQ